MRLDKLLSNSGYGSRSQVRKLIRDGFVHLGDSITKDPSKNIRDEQIPSLSIHGRAITYSRCLYLCLYKPDKHLTALCDRRLPTIAEFIPEKYRNMGISPVGRLDYHTTGVLLLTNDGELSHRLTGLKWHVPKTYLVQYSGAPLDINVCNEVSRGMVLSESSGKKVSLSPAELCLLDSNVCRLTLHEGKTHQVKRMLAAFSRTVTELHRETFAGISLPNNQHPGEIRLLSEEEVQALREQTGLQTGILSGLSDTKTIPGWNTRD
jgi:16S rRNA pseudouridine516 synthase